jgi:hypothetical protein
MLSCMVALQEVLLQPCRLHEWVKKSFSLNPASISAD